MEQTTSAGLTVQQSLGTYGDAATTSWGSGPLAPGAVIADPSVLDAQPGKWVGLNAQGYCSACRQGDVLYPFVYLMDGSNPQAHNGPWAFTDTHLYSGSAEIASTPVNGLPAFTLPAAPATYRMTADGDGTHTEWHFASSRRTSDQAPPAGITCIGTFFGDGAPCRADPLVFLRYDAGLSLDNTLSAPGRHQLTVTAYHQDPAAPAITGLKLSVSVDGGATWHRAVVRKLGYGRYLTTLALPSLAKTKGHLSLRAEATDAAGNNVTQAIDPAIMLVAR